jgi:hypothetical protein
MNAYTNNPTTTVGKARRVLRHVMTSRFPGNDSMAMKNPRGSPTRLASRVDVALTLRETETMSTISGSRDTTRRIAEKKLSIRKSMAFPLN